MMLIYFFLCPKCLQISVIKNLSKIDYLLITNDFVYFTGNDNTGGTMRCLKKLVKDDFFT